MFYGISVANVMDARMRIGTVVRRTRLITCDAPHLADGSAVFFKMESEQETGSFKVRGAANRLLTLSSAERARGVIAVSTGNHARAVAWIARQLGIVADVYLSCLVPQNKVDAIKAVGAAVHIVGRCYDEAYAEATARAADNGAVLVPPFDDPHVIAGQGTIGLELLDDLPNVTAVVVPLSGGGLIGGIALAIKSLRPTVKVIGVSMETGPSMFHSQNAGRPVVVEEGVTIADSLAGGIGLDNKYTFKLVRELVDEILLVSESQIAQAMEDLYRWHGIVTEGAAAVGLAALQTRRCTGLGSNIAVVASGQNVDREAFATIIGRCAGNNAPSRNRP